MHVVLPIAELQFSPAHSSITMVVSSLVMSGPVLPFGEAQMHVFEMSNMAPNVAASRKSVCVYFVD